MRPYTLTHHAAPPPPTKTREGQAQPHTAFGHAKTNTLHTTSRHQPTGCDARIHYPVHKHPPTTHHQHTPTTPPTHPHQTTRTNTSGPSRCGVWDGGYGAGSRPGTETTNPPPPPPGKQHRTGRRMKGGPVPSGPNSAPTPTPTPPGGRHRTDTTKERGRGGEGLRCSTNEHTPAPRAFGGAGVRVLECSLERR
jgi:hypothetical protein